MPDTNAQLNHSALEDERELSRLGYAQELFRTMGGFSNFALSFSIISILTGAVTLYGHGLTMGGPAEMAFGWPLVTFFTLTVAMGISGFASALPTSGAMYHWSSRLGGGPGDGSPPGSISRATSLCLQALITAVLSSSPRCWGFLPAPQIF